jgi:DNA-binding PadR family transcriptional regulator
MGSASAGGGVMKYTITINQAKSLEWGLNAQQALLFAFVYECPSWTNPVKTDEGIFFALSKSKIVEELPLLTDKADTAYRLLKALEKAGLIELSSTSRITLFRLTEKAKQWNQKIDGSEKYPTPSENTENKGDFRSEKSPIKVGKKSDLTSEKSPTNKETNNKGINNKVSLVDTEALFASFWKLYPRKVSKEDARKAWAKLKITQDLYDTIVEALAVQVATDDWKKEKGKFVPHPATWINGKRWEDEVPEQEPTTFNAHQFAPRSKSSGPDFDSRGWAENMDGGL